MSGAVRPSGHLQVLDPGTGRRWHVLWRDAEGRHQEGPRTGVGQGQRQTHAARRRRLARGQRPQAGPVVPDAGRRGRPATRDPRRSAARDDQGTGPSAHLRRGRDGVARARRAQARPKALDTQDYRYLLRNHLLPAFGDRPLRAITRQEIERWPRCRTCKADLAAKHIGPGPELAAPRLGARIPRPLSCAPAPTYRAGQDRRDHGRSTRDGAELGTLGPHLDAPHKDRRARSASTRRGVAARARRPPGSAHRHGQLPRAPAAHRRPHRPDPHAATARSARALLRPRRRRPTTGGTHSLNGENGFSQRRVRPAVCGDDLRRSRESRPAACRPVDRGVASSRQQHQAFLARRNRRPRLRQSRTAPRSFGAPLGPEATVTQRPAALGTAMQRRAHDRCLNRLRTSAASRSACATVRHAPLRRSRSQRTCQLHM
jgi:hypothetical protein